MGKIKSITAREILDSRGNPTVEVDIVTPRGCSSAKVPSGASTGIHEALELRDGGKRYLGKGVLKAVHHVTASLAPKLRGKDPTQQRVLDNFMTLLDGTPNKSHLGANAILGVSMAIARAAAFEKKLHLFNYLATLTKRKLLLPVPFCNIINGGKHAGTELQFQEFMIAPVYATSFSEATRCVSETYHILKTRLEKKYGKSAANVGDEGGFAPPLRDPRQALELIQGAVEEAGYADIIKLAMDAAASEFFRHGMYHTPKKMKPMELVDYYDDLIHTYPIVSLEDPFDQDDFTPYKELMQKTRIQIVGDDLLVTNVNRINIALERGLCNALLLKVNQIGTVTEAIDAALLAFDHRWNVMVSHRSGETDDTFIADLAVGLGCGQVKIGAPCRGERVAKFNRLLQIEDVLGKKAAYAKWKHG
ncbi:phosphopyruvate hydratase [Candidatus Woesearchaeota archaeon]|nr:phosphopyruvate hydratase [Candidatus Woesearchaeota archaeon]